jgi:uncharacterized membrane protein
MKPRPEWQPKRTGTLRNVSTWLLMLAVAFMMGVIYGGWIGWGVAMAYKAVTN